MFRVRSVAGLTLLAASAAAWASDGLMHRIEREIGLARCTQDSDCRTLPLGERPCGGPDRYLAWSTRQSKPARLEAWAAAYTAMFKQRQKQEDVASTCEVRPDPGARCVGLESGTGRCTLGDASADPRR